MTSPVFATFLSFLFGALINSCFILLQNEQALAIRGKVLFYDLGQFCALGLGALAVNLVWRRFGSRHRFATFAAMWILLQLLGWLTLVLDLESFSRRMSQGHNHHLVLVPTLTLFASTVPLTWLLGGWSRNKWWRYLCLLGGTLGFVVNGLVLPTDYPGAHLYLALCSALLVRVGVCWMPFPRFLAPLYRDILVFGWRKFSMLLIPIVLATTTIVFPAPGQVSTAWSRHDGSVLRPFVNRLRARYLDLTAVYEANQYAHNPWFQERSWRPPVLARPFQQIPDRPVVIFLTVEALRADVIYSGKYDPTIPNLAELRDSSTIFTNTRTAGSKTIYSLAALFSGVYFSQQYWTPAQGSKGKSFNTPQDDHPRFTELLQSAGVTTVSIRGISWFYNKGGLLRGMQEEPFVKHEKYPAPCDAMASRLIERLEQPITGPLFIYSHWYDPHHPYNSSKAKGSKFDRYVGEVGLVDQCLGRVRVFLEQTGLVDRTFLVISADHGEAFGEHSTKYHPGKLYEEHLQVPLVFSGPNVNQRQVHQPASLIDIAPSMLELFGQKQPGHLMGQSLIPFLFGETVRLTRPIAAETMLKQMMVFENGIKVIVDNHSGSKEVYDLKADPKELVNIVDQPAAQRYLSLLRSFFFVHKLQRQGYKHPYFR